jgi:hypothetical protein
MAEAKKTTDHDEIRRWVESRGGKPAHVAETGGGDDPGVLRIDFDEPGGNGDERLERMSGKSGSRLKPVAPGRGTTEPGVRSEPGVSRGQVLQRITFRRARALALHASVDG